MTNKPTPESVTVQMKAAKHKALINMAKIQRAVFFDISKRIIDATPVATGRARGGWHGDVNRLSAAPDFAIVKGKHGKEVGSRAAATAEAMASVQEAVDRHEPGQSLTLGNAVPYIRYLNDGSSKQAPAGMTDAAIGAYSQIVQEKSRSAV